MFAEPGLFKQLNISIALNWLVGPLLMTALAWATLPDLPAHRNGVILVGLARCIAMVLLWNNLANGSAHYCTILVAVNSCLQLLLYSPMAVLFISILSTPGSTPDGHNPGMLAFFWLVAQGVLVFMGVPFVLGVCIRYGVRALAGVEWFERVFVPRFSPLALVGLLYTIFVLFAVQGRDIVNQIGPVARVAVPMALYFALMFGSTLLLARRLNLSYALAVTQAFTASSNNFELAIAIAVATFGVTSPEALAAVVGPLIEVPVMLAMVSVALRMQPWWERRGRARCADGRVCEGGVCDDDDANVSVLPLELEAKKAGQAALGEEDVLDVDMTIDAVVDEDEFDAEPTRQLL